MFVSVLKYCLNQVLLLSTFTFHLKQGLAISLNHLMLIGINFPTQQLHQTSSAESLDSLGWGWEVGMGGWGPGGSISNF